MKLVRFTLANAASVSFGVVIQEQAVPFDALQKKAGKSYPYLTDSRSYLVNLPESERAAKDLLAWGEQHLGHLGDGERFPLNAVRLLEPVEVTALYDFGLTPRHLKNSAETLMKYEKDNPQTAPLLQAFAKVVLAPKPKSKVRQPESLSYYKCNMNSIVGNGETVPWPAYTRGWTSNLSWPLFMETINSRWQAFVFLTMSRLAMFKQLSSSAGSA